MESTKNSNKGAFRPIGVDFVERLGEDSWTYIKTVVDIVHEPILILDKDLRVMAANGSFYRTFRVKPNETVSRVVYELGNGQWNIPGLRKLLEDILPKKSFFRGFEVIHEFPGIGRMIIMLNARQIYCKDESPLAPCPPIILLAMEDVTDMMALAKKLAAHTSKTVAKEVKEKPGNFFTSPFRKKTFGKSL